jgi:hypothetical protein
MKFTKDSNASGTSLQGYVTAYYHELVAVFGEPDLTNGDKVTAEWCLDFEDGTVATIYDWKEYETPMGRYQWHIGGRNQDAVDAVITTLRETANA